MLRLIALFSVLTGGLLAQGESCPDQITQTVDPVVTAQFPQTCGANLNTTVGGISISTPVNICPLIVLIRPGYDATAESPGSRTYTQPVETTPILALEYHCEESWLLGLIPIIISSRCVGGNRNVVGVVTHYAQISCQPGGSSGTGAKNPDDNEDPEGDPDGEDSESRIHVP